MYAQLCRRCCGRTCNSSHRRTIVPDTFASTAQRCTRRHDAGLRDCRSHPPPPTLDPLPPNAAPDRSLVLTAVITSKKTTVLAQSAPTDVTQRHRTEMKTCESPILRLPACHCLNAALPVGLNLAPRTQTEVSLNTLCLFCQASSPRARTASLHESNQRTILPCATKKASSRDGWPRRAASRERGDGRA